MSIWRTLIEGEKDEIWIEPDESICDTITGYFDRLTDKTQIENAIIQRYGTGIRITKDAAGNTLETYVKSAFAERVYNGSIDSISIGFGQLVVDALATLFCEDKSRFTLSSEGKDDTSAELEFLNKHRDAGGFQTEIVRADKLAVQCLSSFLLLEFLDGHVRYRAFPAGRIRVCYGFSVESEGQTRPANTLDLEDAQKVIIHTGDVDTSRKSYLAICGQSSEYPNGRWVTYTVSTDTKELPSVGGDGVFDFLWEGQPANPMTIFAKMNPDLNVPEYPIAILYGAPADSLLPVSTSLHQESLDADVAASHLRSTSQDAARGTMAISRTIEAKGATLPRSLVGNVDLMPGLSLEHISHDSPASETAWNVLREELVQNAASHGVPDYMVVSEDHTLDASSGVALEIKTRPLRKKMGQRETANTLSVRKIFEVEKVLIAMFADGSTSEINALLACEQNWEYNGVTLPTNPNDTADRVIKLLDKGIIDTIAAIREINGFVSDDEAIAEYERLKERRKKYPPLNAEEMQQMQQMKKQVGLLRGINRNNGEMK